MGLEAVIGEIRTKGQKEADAIRGETRNEVTRILNSSQDKAAKIKLQLKNPFKNRSGTSRARSFLQRISLSSASC